MGDIEKSPKLKLADHALNTFQAGLLAVPHVGSALEKLLFGAVQEKRLRRVEETLKEVGEKLAAAGIDPPIEGNESLADFMENVIPHAAKATGESKRQRFRDLIFNAIQLPDRDPEWEDVAFVTSLLTQVDDVGLEILSCIYSFMNEQPSNVFALSYRGDDCMIGVMADYSVFCESQPWDTSHEIIHIRGKQHIIDSSLETMRDLNLLRSDNVERAHNTRQIGDGQLFYILMDWVISRSPDNESIPNSETFESQETGPRSA